MIFPWRERPEEGANFFPYGGKSMPNTMKGDLALQEQLCLNASDIQTPKAPRCSPREASKAGAPRNHSHMSKSEMIATK